MAKEISISEMVMQCEVMELREFVFAYTNKNREFRNAFLNKFNPSKISTGDKKAYAAMVSAAFANNPFTVRGRHRNWTDYGFDAEGVREDLELLLDKATWFIQYENYNEAIIICQAMIETIPDEWEDQFDHDGDVQVMYDGAIDRLQEMLDRNALSKKQKENLFEWYDSEIRKHKHKYIGLDTNLGSLQNYFTETNDMLAKTLLNIDERIHNAGSDYEKEDAILNKINILQKTNQPDKAAEVIDRYISFKRIRELRFETLIKQNKYAEAIELIKKGIQIAVTNKHSGNIGDWQEKLFDIYEFQKDTKQALIIAEELFYNNHRDKRKYYDYIKKHTPEKTWLQTVERFLSKMDNSYWGFNTFKADILIEHKMWDRLFAMCLKAGTEHLEHYEKYLKPVYAKELFDAFHKYVEQQATITDKGAYKNVARVLKKMKHYPDGKEVVAALLKNYREVYKRRKYMMKELEGV